VHSSKDLVLDIWEAINLIAEVEMFPETDEISRMFSQAEMVLFELILRIVSTRRIRDRSPLRLISSSADSVTIVRELNQLPKKGTAAGQ
jgi:hypothetical protein